MPPRTEHLPLPELNPELAGAYARTFICRRDCYPMQLDDGSYVTVKKPLTTELVVLHLMGTVTLGAYALDENSAARWLCLDADEEKQWVKLRSLHGHLYKEGITAYLELSRRGGHLWLFTALLPGEKIRRFGHSLMAKHSLDGIELYPKQDKLTTGVGSLVRLPLGIHRKIGRRYHFITPDGSPLAPTVREQVAIMPIVYAGNSRSAETSRHLTLKPREASLLSYAPS